MGSTHASARNVRDTCDSTSEVFNTPPSTPTYAMCTGVPAPTASAASTNTRVDPRGVDGTLNPVDNANNNAHSNARTSAHAGSAYPHQSPSRLGVTDAEGRPRAASLGSMPEPTAQHNGYLWSSEHSPGYLWSSSAEQSLRDRMLANMSEAE